jgi:hypothetical protein
MAVYAKETKIWYAGHTHESHQIGAQIEGVLIN